MKVLCVFALLFVLFLSAGVGVESGVFPTKERVYPHEEVQPFAKFHNAFAGTVVNGMLLRAAVVDFLSPDAAYGHSVKKCTRSGGVVSNQTSPYSRHLTRWRFDRNGYRYTLTLHQVLTQSGWQTTDRFYGRINKGRC